MLEPLVSPQAQGQVYARVEAEQSVHRLFLRTTTARGSVERVLTAARCESLARAAAVVVAVEVDAVEAESRSRSLERVSPIIPAPEALDEGRGEQSLLPSARSSGADPGESTAPAVAPPTPRRRPGRVGLGADAGVGVGVLPGVHGVVEVGGGITWSRWAFRIQLNHRLARFAEQPAGGGASISMSGGAVGAGPIVAHGDLELAVLAVAEAGVMVAAGRELVITRTVASPWLGIGLQPAITWSLAPWLAVRGALTLSGSVLRPHFRIDDGPLIHSTSSLGARVSLGIEIRPRVRRSGPSRRPRG